MTESSVIINTVLQVGWKDRFCACDSQAARYQLFSIVYWNMSVRHGMWQL